MAQSNDSLSTGTEGRTLRMDGWVVPVNFDDRCDSCGRSFETSSFAVAVAVDDDYVHLHEICVDGYCERCGAPVRPEDAVILSEDACAHRECPPWELAAVVDHRNAVIDSLAYAAELALQALAPEYDRKPPEYWREVAASVRERGVEPVEIDAYFALKAALAEAREYAEAQS